ncbi:MAG: alpha/beta hydrolase family protein [bacterium]
MPVPPAHDHPACRCRGRCCGACACAAAAGSDGRQARRRRLLSATAGTLLAALAALSPAAALAPGPASAARGAAPPTGAGVGHRAFPLQPGAGGRAARRLLFWYPSTEGGSRTEPAGHGSRIWRDAPAAPGRHPVVLVSHGFLGAADQSLFITANLARMGYVVAAIDPGDAIDRGARMELPDVLRPGNWTDATQSERRNDLVGLLDRLEGLDGDADAFLHRRLDLGRIGAIGHSLGGYAVLGLAGARTAWRDARIHAVAGLSPYTAPYLMPGGFGSIEIPVMLQGGSFDFGITPLLPRFHALLRAPRYLLVLRGGNHLGWTDHAIAGQDARAAIRDGNPRWIFEYLLAFLDHHLRGLDRTPVLRTPNPALESFESDPGRVQRTGQPAREASPRSRADSDPMNAANASGVLATGR